jgi:hypothetical protein
MSRTSPAQLLLQVRALHERLARRRTAEAVAVRDAEERAARAMQSRLAGIGLPHDASTEEFAGVAASRRALAGLVVAQWQRASAAAADVDVARLDWAAAERDREAMLRVVAQLRAEADARRARLEQREADDLATGRHPRPTEPGTGDS